MREKKFNWVDILILLLIIVAIVVIFNRSKLFGEKGSISVSSEKKELIVTAKSYPVPLEVASSFKVGDKMMANSKILDGEAIDVEYKPSDLFVISDKGAGYETGEDLYDVYVTFKLVANSNASYIEFGNQELKVGQKYYLSTVNAVTYGYIVEIKE